MPLSIGSIASGYIFLTPTPSVTPTITPTPSVTPTITPTPSITPTVSVTLTKTPTQTPTPTPAPVPLYNTTPFFHLNYTKPSLSLLTVTIPTQSRFNGSWFRLLFDRNSTDAIFRSIKIKSSAGVDIYNLGNVFTGNFYYRIPTGAYITFDVGASTSGTKTVSVKMYAQTNPEINPPYT